MKLLDGARRTQRTAPGNPPWTVVAAVLAGSLLPGAIGACGPGHIDSAARTATLSAGRDHAQADTRASVSALNDVSSPSRQVPLGSRIHQVLRVETQEILPHDPQAFTQGLEFRGGTLYESTGLVGRSSVRAGTPGKPPTLYAELSPPLFGEAITVSGDRLWQITWRDGIAIERDPTTLAERRRVTYHGEGWGLCHRRVAGREHLVMSDGTDRLTFRDPYTFEATDSISVRQDGQPVTHLNELECAPDGSLYANVYPTDVIVRIDPRTGTVTAHIDATGLLKPSERRSAQALNGIAAVPGSSQFLITGKLWPHMFKVSFVPEKPPRASPDM